MQMRTAIPGYTLSDAFICLPTVCIEDPNAAKLLQVNHVTQGIISDRPRGDEMRKRRAIYADNWDKCTHCVSLCYSYTIFAWRLSDVEMFCPTSRLRGINYQQREKGIFFLLLVRG